MRPSLVDPKIIPFCSLQISQYFESICAKKILRLFLIELYCNLIFGGFERNTHTTIKAGSDIYKVIKYKNCNMNPKSEKNVKDTVVPFFYLR